MNIPTIKRPWEKDKKQGTRYAPDPYYQSQGWKMLRNSFRAGYTEWNGEQVSNLFCLECYKAGRMKSGRHTDHIIGRKQGGQDTHANLQTLCDSCHARKSANEGKKFK